MKAHTQKPLVLCEGKEDRLVMQAIARHAGIEDKLSFEDYGGESKLREYLAALMVRGDFRRGEIPRILVTRDADANFDSAWASITGSIQISFGCDIGQPGMWVVTESGAEVTAWVVPGPGQPGMIETLCLNAARSSSPEMFGCLDPFIDCLGRLQEGTPHDKVRFAIWTIIAQGAGAQDRLSIERALSRLHLDWSNEVFLPLTEIFTDLSR